MIHHFHFYLSYNYLMLSLNYLSVHEAFQISYPISFSRLRIHPHGTLVLVLIQLFHWFFDLVEILVIVFLSKLVKLFIRNFSLFCIFIVWLDLTLLINNLFAIVNLFLNVSFIILAGNLISIHLLLLIDLYNQLNLT